MQHIALSKWADVLVICPATGDLINGIVTGRADDLVKAVCLAYDFQNKPFLIAPSMNTVMLKNPITQENIQKLSRMGVHILPTKVGNLACGDYGEGKLLNPEAIALYIRYSYALHSHDKREILITAGGTSEDLDGVREISNFSTGRTGAFLADFLTVAGHSVTLLRSKSSVKSILPLHEIIYSSSKDLDSLLQKELEGKRFDAVIQLAAVSDFVVDHLLVDGVEVTVGEGDLKKLSSDSSLAIVMKKNKKIINDIKKYSSNPKLKLIGFKLTHNMTAEAAQRKIQKIFDGANADFVVHNELSEISATSHPAKVYSKDQANYSEVSTKEELAWELHQVITNHLPI
ncbi:MAG: phosphopantothenoylcysteine decarboxylase/phosphopantothenate--cysteine ligase [Chlamydiales bacterium]|jgi:phosphopantothenoylcysteine decarboxylase/phosphopantothenate--cysteine ligase